MDASWAHCSVNSRLAYATSSKRANEDVDEVELDQTQTADDTRDLACRRRPFGARLREALGA